MMSDAVEYLAFDAGVQGFNARLWCGNFHNKAPTFFFFFFFFFFFSAS